MIAADRILFEDKLVDHIPAGHKALDRPHFQYRDPLAVVDRIAQLKEKEILGMQKL